MNPPPLWVVEWADAFTESVAWHHDGTPLPGDPVVVRSVGYILRGARPGYLVLASATYVRDGDRVYGGIDCIPKAMVLRKFKVPSSL